MAANPLHLVLAAGLLAGPSAAQVSSDPPIRLADPAHHHASEFRASTFSHSTQAEPSIAVAPDGAMTAVWSSRRQQGGRYGVYAQRFDADGVVLGGETRLNLWTRSHAMSPVVAHGPAGNVWAAWLSTGQDGSGGAVIARRFTSALIGDSEILVNERTEGEQFNPVICALADGGAAIAWESASPSGPARVAFRLFDADGLPRTGEITLTTPEGRRLATPSIALATDGTLAIAVAAFDGPKPAGIEVHRFDAAGAKLGSQRVTPERALTPVEPAIAATGGGFVLAWQDVAEASAGYDVFAMRLDGAGSPVGDPVLAHTVRDGRQNAAAVAVLAGGGIAVAFNAGDASDSGVFIRRFETDLRPLGPESRLTVHADGPQEMREALGTTRLAPTPDGGVVCAWTGDAGFGDASGVHITRVSPSPIALGARTPGVTPAMPSASDGVVVALSGGPEPHEPPTFDPKDADAAAREIIRGRGGEIGFTGIINTGWTPPDPHMAVGPDHVVLMTNGAIAFFEKDGTKTFQDEIEDSFGFWGDLGTTGFVFDPEVIFDAGSGRFFAMAAEAFAPGGRSYCLVAVSDDSDPNGTWYKYRFETTGLAGDLFDSPNIGVTDDTLVITGDGFGISANYPVYVYDKASLLAGDPPAVERSFTLATSTQSAGYPRVTTGNDGALIFVEHRESSNNNTQIRLIAVEDLLGQPTVTDFDLTVPVYGAPEDPPQRGTSSTPNTFDARFWSVDQGPGGHIWATHHINPDKVVARWYDIDLRGWPHSGNSPVLTQSGDVDLGSDIRTYFSAINASDDGTVALTFARSSPNEFISMASAYRTPCMPLGFLTEDFIHKETAGGYTRGRWGDYAAVEFDPTDPTLYWAHHEYADNNSWRTWVQSVATFDECRAADLNGDGVVNIIDMLEFLNAWNGGECVGDWTRDGVYNTLDVLGYLNAWSACR